MFGQVINRVGKIADFGLKKGKRVKKRAHSHPIFLGVSPCPERGGGGGAGYEGYSICNLASEKLH